MRRKTRMRLLRRKVSCLKTTIRSATIFKRMRTTGGDEHAPLPTDENEYEPPSHFSYSQVSSPSQDDLDYDDETQNETAPRPLPRVDEAYSPPFDPEVEKLRLQLEHDREMEKLRQQGRTQELEELRLQNEAYPLELEDKKLQNKNRLKQKKLMIQALQKQQESKKLLSEIKQAVRGLLEESQQLDYSTSDLETLFKSFADLKEQVEILMQSQAKNFTELLILLRRD